MEQGKKEKVLHTRISEALDEELRDEASKLGLSVSKLVRNVLHNTFGLVEEIISDTASVARGVTPGDHRDGSAAAEGVVVAWQEVVLNLNAICEACNGILAKGTRGMIGVLDGPGDKPFRCVTCVGAASEEADHAVS